MPVSSKKVIVRRYSGPVVWGYAPSANFVSAGQVQILDPAAKLNTLDLNDIKTISYVWDFNLNDPLDPERIGRRNFSGRPRGEGLWLKLEFRDRDILEGLAHIDLGFLDSLIGDMGLTISPPDTKSNTQKIFVPRSSLTNLQVLGWITSPSKQKAPNRPRSDAQGGLFEP